MRRGVLEAMMSEPTLSKKNYAEEVVEFMCQSYATVVNSNDSMAYSKLFTQAAIRIPPGSFRHRSR